MQSLHDNILRIRDKSLAHSDLSELDAKLYIGDIGGNPFPLIIKNTGSHLPDLNAVRLLIEEILDNLYEELKRFEKAL